MHRDIEISKDYIIKAYQEGHYVEAVVLTHYVINVFMNMTFDIVVTLRNPSASLNKLIRQSRRSKRKKSYPISDYKYLTIANILWDMGIYNKNLYTKLEKFNHYRNTVAHRLFSNIPSESDLSKYCELGIKLWDETWKILQQHHQKYFASLEKFLNSS